MAPTVEQSSPQDPSREGRHVGPDTDRLERLVPVESLNLVETPDGPLMFDGQVHADTDGTGEVVLFSPNQGQKEPYYLSHSAFVDVDPDTGRVSCCLMSLIPSGNGSPASVRFVRVADGRMVEESVSAFRSVGDKVVTWPTHRLQLGQVRTIDIVPRTVSTIGEAERQDAYEASLHLGPDGLQHHFDGAEPDRKAEYGGYQVARSDLVALGRLEGEKTNGSDNSEVPEDEKPSRIVSRVLHEVATAQARNLVGEGAATDSPAFAEAYRRAYEGVVSGSAELRDASDELSEARKSRMGREALAQIFRGRRAA
jgi:hypothetical protein